MSPSAENNLILTSTLIEFKKHDHVAFLSIFFTLKVTKSHFTLLLIYKKISINFLMQEPFEVKVKYNNAIDTSFLLSNN